MKSFIYQRFITELASMLNYSTIFSAKLLSASLHLFLCQFYEQLSKLRSVQVFRHHSLFFIRVITSTNFSPLTFDCTFQAAGRRHRPLRRFVVVSHEAHVARAGRRLRRRVLRRRQRHRQQRRVTRAQGRGALVERLRLTVHGNKVENTNLINGRMIILSNFLTVRLQFRRKICIIYLSLDFQHF